MSNTTDITDETGTAHLSGDFDVQLTQFSEEFVF
jgi:hypothetical protein